MASFAQLHDDLGLPSSVHTEIAILGAMLLDSVAVTDATARLDPDDFSLDSHKRIYACIGEMVAVGHAIDTITVAANLEQRRELEAIGGRAYLSFLTEGIPHKLNIEDYVRIVKDKSLSRKAMALFDEGLKAFGSEADEALSLINDLSARLGEIVDGSIQRDLSSLEQIVQESFGTIDDLMAQAQEVTGVRTHYAQFDRMTSGLQKSELIIIAARPSMGKTAWAINIAQNAALRSDAVVAVFSLEMSKESLLRRMLGSEALVSARNIQQGFIGREDRGKLVSALDRLMSAKLFIDDTPGIALPEMRAKARRLMQNQGKLDLIVIDYLQLMTAGGSGSKRPENRTQEVSQISRGLKALAKELNVPVVALSQLSRGSEQRTGDKKPLLSDLRESGSIEQDADVVCFIHRPEYYERDNEDLKGKAEIIIAKQRNGPTGTVEMMYLSDFTRFEDAGASGDDSYPTSF